MVQDTTNIKEKIVSILRQRGPSLPVHIAGATGLSILFASAFLSELFSEKKIKISNMKVGNSPIYFLPEQEHLLENFSQYIKGKEKEAFLLLKEKKFLKDSEQEPAIRVALRSIKDFAIAFKKDDEIFWKYFIEKPELKIKETQKEIKPSSTEKGLDIFNEQKPKKEKQIIKKKKTMREKSSKVNEKFFNKVKEYLSEKSIEISGIEGFSKKDLILKVKINGEEKVLVAYNKKRVTEQDIIKAHKKATELELKYIVLSLGEPVKKISNFIRAIRNLEEMSQI